MGAGLEMIYKTVACLIAVMGFLAACGTDPIVQDSRGRLPKVQALSAMVTAGFTKPKPVQADPAAVAALRRALEKAGQPVLLVKVPNFGYANLFAAHGQNDDVTTWASASAQSVALQDGLLVATRGFGADLMSAKVPTLAQVRRGSGRFERAYYDLDGADQTRHLTYDCLFAQAGVEPIDVFGKRYPTRKVTEMCSGPDLSFENTYWFDPDGTLRQSAQHATPRLPLVQIGQVLD